MRIIFAIGARVIPSHRVVLATLSLLGVFVLPINAQEPAPSGVPTASAAATSSSSSSAQKADTEWDGVSVELTSVTRGDGDTLTIKFKYTNNGSKPVNVSKIGQFSHDNLAEKVYYIDTKNKKKYFVIKDSEGHAVASNMKYLELGPGESKGGWLKMPGPPSGVNTITVYIPGTPPFESVAIAH